MAGKLLKCPQMDVIGYRSRYEELEKRLGVSFETVRFVIDHIPLCLRPPRHAAMRMALAERIRTTQPDLVAVMPRLVEQRFRCLLEREELDVHSDVVVPLVSDVLSILSEVTLEVDEDSLISRLFSSTLGPRRRLRMEAELLGMRRALEEKFSGDDIQDIGLRLAMAVVGRDALMGTLSNSLHAVFLAADSKPLNRVDYPHLPPRTGVPFVDREVLKDVAVDETHFYTGQIVRVQLNELETTDDPEDRRMFFGAGRHVCLGRPFSLQLWEMITDYLSGLDRTVGIISYTLRKDDVFAIPSTFTIRIFK